MPLQKEVQDEIKRLLQGDEKALGGVRNQETVALCAGAILGGGKSSILW